MTTRETPRTNRSPLVAGSLAVLLFLPAPSLARTPPARVARSVDDSVRVALQGSRTPLARPELEVGRVAKGTRLEGVALSFARTPAQEADLEALIAAQQDPASPLHRRWLTPEEFASRFGVAPSDIATVTAWLAAHGLRVDSVSRSRNLLRLSGSVSQLEDAFGTELHHYRHGDRTDFAPSTEVSIPAALSPLVASVRGLSSFRPRSHFRSAGSQLSPEFTSSQSGGHFLTPADVATIYDITPAYTSGIDGTGETIAVVGQSAVVVGDIERFQAAAGVPVRDPVLSLVPGSGKSTLVTGDESESDLDLEYTSAIAKGATVDFVYVGDGTNQSVWDALVWATDSDLAPVISMSYGICETALSSSDYSFLNGWLKQAAAQGQSVVVAAGDSGSTDCDRVTSLSTAQRGALAVDFPASSQYATGIGGTEFPDEDVASTNSVYWTPAGSGDVTSSALSYIPEQVWNDTTTTAIEAGGGGVSTLTEKPSWQAGVPGIPSGTHRFVPDVSLDASAMNAAFLFCSSDAPKTINGSCANGFRDSTNVALTAGGGTSFSAPIFAGMVALLNQKLGTNGLGVLGPTLYALAADSATYTSAFHDITDGGNECGSSGTNCSTAGASEYAATVGYDEASGLGSVDFFSLLNAWPGSTSLPSSVTTVSASSVAPAVGAPDTITITVASGSSSTTAVPTGAVLVAVDGSTAAPSLALFGGSATYNFSSFTAGTHVISASYGGDSTYRASSGSTSVVVGGKKGFTLSATNATVASGGSGTSTVTVTPTNGYTGTITWTIASSPALSGGCLSLANTAISGASSATAILTINASSSLCNAAAVAGSTFATGPKGEGRRGILNLPSGPRTIVASTLLLLFGVALAFRRRPVMPILASMACAAALLLSACGGGGGGSGSPATVAKGTYTVAVVGRDTKTPTIIATATFTLTID